MGHALDRAWLLYDVTRRRGRALKQAPQGLRQKGTIQQCLLIRYGQPERSGFLPTGRWKAQASA